MTEGPSRITEIEEFNPTASRRREAKAFKYRKPDLKGRRALVPLARSDIALAMVQVFKGTGGEQELHSHSATDGFWFVLSGKARFYGEGDVVIAELERHDGVFIPRDVPYWFETCGEDDLELLQVEAIDGRVPNRVKRYDAQKQPGKVEVFRSEGELIASEVQLGR